MYIYIYTHIYIYTYMYINMYIGNVEITGVTVLFKPLQGMQDIVPRR